MRVLDLLESLVTCKTPKNSEFAPYAPVVFPLLGFHVKIWCQSLFSVVVACLYWFFGIDSILPHFVGYRCMPATCSTKLPDLLFAVVSALPLPRPPPAGIPTTGIRAPLGLVLRSLSLNWFLT